MGIFWSRLPPNREGWTQHKCWESWHCQGGRGELLTHAEILCDVQFPRKCDHSLKEISVPLVGTTAEDNLKAIFSSAPLSLSHEYKQRDPEKVGQRHMLEKDSGRRERHTKWVFWKHVKAVSNKSDHLKFLHNFSRPCICSF